MSKSIKLGAITCSVAAIIGVVQTYFSDEIRINQAGLEIIGNMEGCRRDAYKCPADVITVGIGSTEFGGQKIDVNHKYTNHEIAERWVHDLKIAQNCINTYFNGRRMNDNQFSAMSSLAFNIGCTNIRSYYSKAQGKRVFTTIYKYAALNQFDAMCQRITDFNKAGGVVLRGLVKRREAERDLCLTKPVSH